MCTPLGFVRLFGVVGQVLVKPHLLRDVDSEFDAFNMEEASVRRKLAVNKETMLPVNSSKNGGAAVEQIMKVVVPSPPPSPTTNSTFNGNVSTTMNNNNNINNGNGSANGKGLYNRVHLQEHKYEASFLHERLREIEADKNELGEWESRRGEENK